MMSTGTHLRPDSCFAVDAALYEVISLVPVVRYVDVACRNAIAFFFFVGYAAAERLVRGILVARCLISP